MKLVNNYSALWVDILYFNNNTRRISVTGHQDGVLNVAVVDVQKCGQYLIIVLSRYNPLGDFIFVHVRKLSCELKECWCFQQGAYLYQN
jgi:hypothetical protein